VREYATLGFGMYPFQGKEARKRNFKTGASGSMFGHC
jgi:hypothetical protein